MLLPARFTVAHMTIRSQFDNDDTVYRSVCAAYLSAKQAAAKNTALLFTQINNTIYKFIIIQYAKCVCVIYILFAIPRLITTCNKQCVVVITVHRFSIKRSVHV